jgi:adenine-specific DNA-methyltransferase
VFTPTAVVDSMLALVRNRGRVLEPACGDGVFLQHFPFAVGIEIDPRHAPPGARVMDFFDLSERESFATIIGNPPYVRYQDIPAASRGRVRRSVLDGRANLYLFFIEKCLRHLAPGGETRLHHAARFRQGDLRRAAQPPAACRGNDHGFRRARRFPAV